MDLGSVEFKLSFQGNESEEHEIDFYDVAQAVEGFQRSLAITTNLVLNNKVITQAPALKKARILARPPVAGSWEIAAIVVAAGEVIYRLGTAPRETPLGHLMYSAYDYVVSQTLGFNVDYNSTLGRQYEQLQRQQVQGLPILDENRFSSVIEKCESALKIMHRPIFASGTARVANVSAHFNGANHGLSVSFDHDTYGYIEETVQDNERVHYHGRVSSYNGNTFKGRIYIPSEGRPIAFVIAKSARSSDLASKLADSLSRNVRSAFRAGDIHISGYRFLSRTGRLKGILIDSSIEVLS